MVKDATLYIDFVESYNKIILIFLNLVNLGYTDHSLIVGNERYYVFNLVKRTA